MGIRLDPEIILVELEPGQVVERPGCPVPWNTEAPGQAEQIRLMVKETKRRAFAAGLTAGRLALMMEMLQHPNPN